MLKTPHSIMKLWLFFVLASVSSFMLTGCNAKNDADQIFYNGDILTMAGKEAAYVEALVVKDGKIV
ncbi:MAG: hypothetical protein HXX14_20510, partial [Bacteroidetes bacterium]|nr:hypothetical protein [Bacteroidota bacterium]